MLLKPRRHDRRIVRLAASEARSDILACKRNLFLFNPPALQKRVDVEFRLTIALPSRKSAPADQP